VAGLWEMREAIAELYNHQYRRGKRSQYSPLNVAVCGGGRLGLARAAAALGSINMGHFLPDYTAYEELLDVFSSFTAIPILLDAQSGYHFDAEDLRREVLGRGLGAVLLSNPANPTGKLIQGAALNSWVEVARELDCCLLMDEFYSNYIWSGPANTPGYSVSAAQFVDDVDKDPVVLFNGLTKNWRYPGWRISWVVGPQDVIDAVTSTGSFLDGGASRPLQRAALPLLTPEHVQQETIALHQAFAHKRQTLLSGLESLGIQIDLRPQGTFYVWGDLSQMAPKLSDGMAFFRAALQHKVIVVPGEFFDVNPGKRRPGRTGRYRQHARFSFGPDLSNISRGLANLKEMLSR
jgi:aspartate/methionine/tyrosine aminotransferase